MRVLIELLDREPMKNVLAPCIFIPDIVVYLCDTRATHFFKESAISRLFRLRKMKTQPRFYYFDATDPVGIRRVIHAVVRDYPGCVFDFSGGRDLVLMVAGGCFTELELPGFYIDIADGSFINLRGCEGLAQSFAIPTFPVEDIFAMNGATIHGNGHFSSKGIDEGFEDSILAIFEVVRKNPKAWGEFVGWLQTVCGGTPSGQLTVAGPRRTKSNRSPVHLNPILLQNLHKAGAITGYQMSKNHAELTFKTPLHRRCLLIEGVWLELYCYVTAKRSGEFDDVMTSVVVDWTGVEGGANNAKNEVDVLLVKGVSALFISCKMSAPSPLAISEIKLLATKFGGSFARAVILTVAELGNEHKALRSRATESGVSLLDSSEIRPGALLPNLLAVAAPVRKPPPRLADSKMIAKP